MGVLFLANILHQDIGFLSDFLWVLASLVTDGEVLACRKHQSLGSAQQVAVGERAPQLLCRHLIRMDDLERIEFSEIEAMPS